MPKSKPSKEKNNFTVKKDKLKRYQFWSIFIWKLLFFLWSNYFLFCRMTFNWQKKKLFGKENWKQKTKKDFWINHTFSSRFFWLKKNQTFFVVMKQQTISWQRRLFTTTNHLQVLKTIWYEMKTIESFFLLIT